ncbi:MAG: hypothetical protein SPG06_05340 [Eubacteriales bacterium]|nr:hypothetical protein [Eubacteriales bacterium]
MENKTIEQNSNPITHVCENCKTEYIGNFCPMCGKQYKDSALSNNTQHNEPTPSISDEQVVEEKNSHFFLKFALFLVSLAILGFIIFGIFSSVYGANSNTNSPSGSVFPTIVTKSAPSVDAEESLSGLIFNVYCPNHNYDYVIISFELYNKDGNIVASRTIRQDNLKKGGTYQLKYTLSIEEQFTVRSMRYKLADYK